VVDRKGIHGCVVTKQSVIDLGTVWSTEGCSYKLGAYKKTMAAAEFLLQARLAPNKSLGLQKMKYS